MTIPFLIKLQSFLDIKPGWSYGEGEPISQESVNRAEQLVTSIIECGLDKMDVFPGLNGEVMISVYDGSSYLELMLEPDNTVTFAQELNGDEVNYMEGLSNKEALAQVINYKEKEKICAISAYSTKDTMTPRAKDSLAQHLSPLLTGMVSQLSPWDALKTLVARSANTSSISTQGSLDPRLCIGSSNRILFQATAT